MKKTLSLILGLGLLAGTAFADAKGDEIARKHFELKKAADTSATASMVLVDKGGAKKNRKLELFTKQGADGKNSFINFLEPADVSGTKFLTLAQKGGGTEQRLYLPALKKTRKISSASKDGEFVNSDFYYYDMEDRVLEDNSYSFLAEGEVLADKAFEGMKFYKVEMKPKDPGSPYAKAIAWVNMDNYGIYRMECYDKKDQALLKTILFVKMDSSSGILIPTQTAVLNNKKGTRTLLQLDNLKVNTGLKDEVFSVKNLEQ
jgi:outer membrane lipoprotein-sorting protein